MRYYTEKQIFHVNSNNRINSGDTHSKFSVKMNFDVNAEYDSVVLLDCSIPKTNYLIRTGYNTFYVEEDSGQRLITIPIGNYTRRSFRNVLTTLLNDNSDGYVYTISFSNISVEGDNGHYVFSYTGGIIVPSFIMGSSPIYEQLGLSPNTTYPLTGGSLESTNIINFKVKNTFYILSDLVQNKNDKILQSILSQSYFDYEYISYQNPNPDEMSKMFVKDKSNVYSFTIVDEDFFPIDFNTSSTSGNVLMTIMVFKRNNIDNLIKGYIKYLTIWQK